MDVDVYVTVFVVRVVCYASCVCSCICVGVCQNPDLEGLRPNNLILSPSSATEGNVMLPGQVSSYDT